MRKSTALAASIAAVAGIAVGIAGTLALTAEPAPRTAHTPTVNTCSHEGDTSCYWDATTQGNGEGRSYYADARGNVYYDAALVESCQALAFNLSGGYGGMLATARAGEPIDVDTFARNYTDKAIPLAAECGIDLAY